MTADRAALVEKVAIVLFNAWNTGRLHDTDGTAFYLANEEDREGFRYEAQSAIDLIRAEVLEEALNALYSVPRWDREIFDSLTQTADGSLIYIDEADAAIRALKDKP